MDNAFEKTAVFPKCDKGSAVPCKFTHLIFM